MPSKHNPGCKCCGPCGQICFTVKGCCTYPLAGALVVLKLGTATIGSGTTNANGTLCLPISASGTYSYTITADGYNLATGSVTASCSGTYSTTNVTATLTLASPYPSTLFLDDLNGTVTLNQISSSIWWGCYPFTGNWCDSSAVAPDTTHCFGGTATPANGRAGWIGYSWSPCSGVTMYTSVLAWIWFWQTQTTSPCGIGTSGSCVGGSSWLYNFGAASCPSGPPASADGLGNGQPSYVIYGTTKAGTSPTCYPLLQEFQRTGPNGYAGPPFGSSVRVYQ